MIQNYALPMGSVLDVDVSVWSLVKYVFKWMFAFLIVNIVLTLPLVFAVLAFYGYVIGQGFPHHLSGPATP